MACSYREHLAGLESRGFAPPTINNRRLSLIGFIRWCEGLGIRRPGDVTACVLERYRSWLGLRRKANGRSLTAITQRERLVAERDYLGWLCRRGVLAGNLAADLELPRPSHTPLHATAERAPSPRLAFCRSPQYPDGQRSLRIAAPDRTAPDAYKTLGPRLTQRGWPVTWTFMRFTGQTSMRTGNQERSKGT